MNMITNNTYKVLSMVLIFNNYIVLYFIKNN